MLSLLYVHLTLKFYLPSIDLLPYHTPNGTSDQLKPFSRFGHRPRPVDSRCVRLKVGNHRTCAEEINYYVAGCGMDLYLVPVRREMLVSSLVTEHRGIRSCMPTFQFAGK